MKMTDGDNGWTLRFTDGRLNYIHIDFRLALDLVDASGTTSLTIETPCRLKWAVGEASLTPSESSSLAPILPLFNAKVIAIAIQKTGQLTVEFGDGHILEVDPDDSYEAWQLGCSSGFMLVCSPGGKVSFFQQTGRSAKAT
jgi:hypothetical protein